MLVLRKDSRRGPTWPDYFADRAGVIQDPLLAGYFAAGCPAPETPIAEVPLVALDIETTGLDPRRAAIVSIGLVPFTLARIRLAERRYWVLKPVRELTEQSVTMHHITHSEVANAPDLAVILPELFEALAGRLAVVHYRHIERPFLDGAIKARLGEGMRFPVIDTMSLEARIHRQSLWARFRRWAGRPPVSIRLHNSRLRYGLPAYQGHHALIDALGTAELLQAQIATRYRPETPVGQLWS
ncbi:3'-5' exonuclease [Halomonas urumqiensis]|uniref:DNA polymerase III subunit epsilon n=1 Tax=Halomonas urumqiensis TaxID=1684789 RepID=A0A2N7UC92_9GAMM|nr:3'-5' exonuclease [Halomonas urumqiensis]PMR78056.1 DNA polymerase III subunit epsilon [Halomonas urumqiensis]PTB03207.1 3'-5' exonuclease [Halomonas urumqiensis]GHE20644.1 3'-5' exonuclease [Halomonas urumqiensis]